MNDELYALRKNLKKKNNLKNNKPKKLNKYFKPFMYKLLISTALVLTVLITTKTSSRVKAIIKQNVYDKNFSFATVNNLYTKYFGSALPFKDLKIFNNDVAPTFNETLAFQEANKYLDGVKLTVEENYLIPIQESGLVVFKGEKDGYGNIVIIQQVNGVDMWYCNVQNENVNLYDYVEKGNLLGEAKGKEIYVVYQKDGKYIDYKEYIKES